MIQVQTRFILEDYVYKTHDISLQTGKLSSGP